MRTRSWLGLGVGGVVATALVVPLVTLDSMHHEPPRAVPEEKPASAPAGLQGWSGDTQVTLRWNSVAGATTYVAFYRDVTKGERLRLCAQEQATAFIMAGLTNGDTYEFQVSARNAAGEGPRSPAVMVRVMPPKPARPSQLQAIAGTDQVFLRWTEPLAPSARFWVEVRDVGANTLFKKRPTSTGMDSYLVTSLLGGHAYQFRVVAENAAGSRTSATVSATPFS